MTVPTECGNSIMLMIKSLVCLQKRSLQSNQGGEESESCHGHILVITQTKPLELASCEHDVLGARW